MQISNDNGAIRAIEKTSIHRITSGQVVIDLQTAVKELVENSMDAGASNIEVRFKQYGLKSVEVVDNGCGIAEKDYDSVALKHHTSKLATFSDLSTVRTFGFRGEALSSLCALCESVTLTTSTTPPMGELLEMEASGKIRKRSKVARQRGTTLTLTNLFTPLPVRRKEFERNVKREFGKALALLNAYALGPCCSGTGIRLTVTNQPDKGQKSVQLRTQGTPSNRASVTALWGPKSMENIVDLDLSFMFERDKASLKRVIGSSQEDDTSSDTAPIPIVVKGLISKFAVGCGRTGTDRQFFYINGRPCNLGKIQKAFNEVYRSFNANQAPLVLADFIMPTELCDINVSPDKRTIFLHSEGNLITSLKAALEESFAASRSTYDIGATQPNAKIQAKTQSLLPGALSHKRKPSLSAKAKHLDDEEMEVDEQDDLAISSSLGAAKDVDEVDVQRRDVAPPSDVHPISSPHTPETQPVSRSSSQFRAPTPELPSQLLHDEDLEDGADTPRSDPPRASPQPRSSSVERQGAEKAVDIVMNTTKAVWSQEKDKEKSSRPNEESEVSEPPRKKRKFDISAVTTPAARTELRGADKAKKSKGDKAQASLRNRLLSFASGSQPVPRQDEEESEKDELEDELDASSDDDREMQKPKDEDWSKKSKKCASPARDRGSPPDVDNHDHGRVESSAASSMTIDLTDDLYIDPEGLSNLELDSSLMTPPSFQQIVSRPEVIRNPDNNEDVSFRFDLSRISDTWRQLHDRLQAVSTVANAGPSTIPKVPLAAGVANMQSDDKATDALARVIDKEDFMSMDIVGQFNLGFIVARRRKLVPLGASQERENGAMDDLFIVDQHAADEKYNFETLQQTTIMKSQKLFRPRPLELTAADELLAIENIDILRQNGFEIDISSDEESSGAGQGTRLKLTAQPVSKSTVFDMKDLEELLHLMRDRPTGQMVRCSKARAMFAMRACRKSVMVGMPLNSKQMLSVVQHMGTMDQPWNCPHGRPTMRHLIDVSNAGSRTGPRKIDWSAFGHH